MNKRVLLSANAANNQKPAFCLRGALFAAASVVLSALPLSVSFAEARGTGLPSYDAGLRRTALPSGVQPGLPAGILPDKPAFADFGVDRNSRTPSFWAYAPERCNMGLFGKVSLEDCRWTYLGAFNAAENLTHCTMSRSGDFHFFKMAGIDSDDDGDGVPDSIARLCANGNNEPGHGAEAGDEPSPLPVSPTLTATPLPRGETAVLAETSKFLYSGPNPIQTGVNGDLIVPERVSVVRGRVLDGDGRPMFGAAVTVHGHPEFGETMSRADGWYDLAVNGNADLTLEFSAPSVISAFRTIHPVAQRYDVVGDVRLVAFDPVATTVQFGGSLTSACLAASSTVTDDSGTRTAALVIPAGTRAFSVEGTVTQVVDRLTIRMTEFTVGDGGPARMPAQLPPTSAYTYCVEFSADEASHVVFDRRIFGYVENFVGIPVGYVVPSAFYDFRREVPAWVPEEDGRVIGVVGVSPDGLAEIDMDGDGAAEPPSDLLSFGFSEDELRLLAARYGVGAELWRVPLEHFSAVDWNYTAKIVDDDAVRPPVRVDNVAAARQSVDAATEGNLNTGGSVGLASRTFLETLPICGTGLNLVYSSDRAVTAGSLTAQCSFNLTGGTVPASMKSVRAEFEIAGRRYEESFVPSTNIVWHCPWDGMDPYGRVLSGSQPATLRIGYDYDGYYAAMASPSAGGKVYTFGQTAGMDVLVRSRQSVELESSVDFEICLGRRDPLFSEWSVDVHHSYDPVTGKLYLGSGEALDASTTASLRDARFVAGTGERGSVEESGNGLARFSRLDTPTAVCVGPDGELYIADSGNHCVRVVDRGGRIRTYAGRPGVQGSDGNGGRATDATLSWPCALALDAAGSLYIADRDAHVVRRVDCSGLIHAVAGNGELDASGDGGLAVNAAMGHPTALAVTRDGTVYVAHGYDQPRIRRIAPDGRVSTVLGGGDVEIEIGDAIDATTVGLYYSTITSLAATEEGNVWITRRTYPYDILCLDNAGVVRSFSMGEAMTPLYVFGPTGRHLETRDAVSRSPILKFGYSEDGALSSIEDADGLVTTFEKKAGCVVVTAPHGQVTTVGLDDSGRPAIVTNPAGERNELEYSGEGLLVGVSNRRGHVFRQTYDELGKVVSNRDPDGGSNAFWAVTNSSDSGTGWQTTVVDGMGRTNLLAVLRRPDGLESRTETGPDGLCTVTTNYTDGSVVGVAPDGSISYFGLSPDPRFGMLAPYISRSEVSTESGRILASETERTVLFADLGDAGSATNICDIVTRNGRVWRTCRDADSLVEITPMGRSHRTVLNPAGHPLVVESPGVFAVTNEYDVEGRLVRTVQGDRETTFAYAAAGCLASVTDALGRSVDTVHDAVGRTTFSTLPDGSAVSNVYDRSESPISTTLPHGETHAFGWTPVGLPSSYTAPEAPDAGRRLDRAYDAAREQTALVKPDGTVVSNLYDSAGRLAAVVATRGEEEEWSALSYDQAGRLEYVWSENGESVYEYDSFLKMAEGSGGFWTDYEYDDDFRVSKKTFSTYLQDEYALLAEIEVAYDGDGDVVRVGELSVDRNPATGFVESTTLGGVSDARAYNGYGEMSDYSAAFGDADLYRMSVARDRLGRVVEREERVLAGDAVTSRYAYDLRGRLVSVTTNGVVSETYAYDANGNRLGGEYDAQDRQRTFGDATYAYDLNGSMTNRNGVALAWNLFGRLVSVGGVTYGRDERQRIRRKDIAGVPAKEWTWSGSQLAMEHDCAADETSIFVYAGATAPAYMFRGESTYRIVADNQGSVRLVVDAATGVVAQRLDYDSFGRVIRDTNPGFQPFGFQGGLYDPDTGLVEFGCRWYDAQTGRWISKDPILLDGGWNVYAFCGNDPVNRTDPSGTFVIAIGGGGATGAGSAVAVDSGLVFGISLKNGFQWGSYQAGGVGFHVGLDVSFGTVVTIAPFAEDITNLSGLTESIGGSIGFGPSGTAELAIPIGATPKGSAVSFSFGAGVGVEKHAITTFTTVQEMSMRDIIEGVKAMSSIGSSLIRGSISKTGK